MQNSVNMDVVRDKMLGRTQNQTLLTEVVNEDELMDFETTDEKDVPIDYSSTHRRVPRDQPLIYKGVYGTDMTRNPEDLNRFVSREKRPLDEQQEEKGADNKRTLNWVPPAQSHGKRRADLDLTFADPNLLSRSAP